MPLRDQFRKQLGELYPLNQCKASKNEVQLYRTGQKQGHIMNMNTAPPFKPNLVFNQSQTKQNDQSKNCNDAVIRIVPLLQSITSLSKDKNTFQNAQCPNRQPNTFQNAVQIKNLQQWTISRQWSPKQVVIRCSLRSPQQKKVIQCSLRSPHTDRILPSSPHPIGTNTKKEEPAGVSIVLIGCVLYTAWCLRLANTDMRTRP